MFGSCYSVTRYLNHFFLAYLTLRFIMNTCLTIMICIKLQYITERNRTLKTGNENSLTQNCCESKFLLFYEPASVSIMQPRRFHIINNLPSINKT